MNYKKIIFLGSFLVIFVFLFNFSVPIAKAMTAEEIKALIQQLQAQITQLQQQLAKIEGKPEVWCYDFKVNLKIGMGGSEVEALHTVLEKEGFSIPQDEKSNKEFDESTASAVTGFQVKYKDEILTPLGLKYGTGYVGKSTRAKLNQLYGCGVTPLPCGLCPQLTPMEPRLEDKLRKECEAKGGKWGAIPDKCGCYGAPQCIMPPVCIQVITPAKDPKTSTCKNFPTPCDVPSGWIKVSSCPTPTPTPVPVPECKALWWYDNNHSYCQQKKFCGAYMYLGLRTFSTEAECNASLSGKSLILISPNGGETWQVGNTYEITWKSSGIEKVNINIFNSRNLFGGLGLGSFPASQGSYSWTIPNDFIDVRTTLEGWQSGDSFQILILEEKSDRSFGIEDRSDNYFNIVNQSTGNLPPVIENISGPTTLKLTEIGAWTVKASDPEKGILTYSAVWGDATGGTQFAPKETTYVQTATFSHLYFKTGIYNPVFIVTDNKGLSDKKSITVKVEELITTETGFHRFKLLDASLCPGCVVGTVCQPCPPESERTIYNGKVSVYDAKGNLVATKDTSSGMAVFENLLYGIYTVTISAPGFESSKSEFIVGAAFGTDSTVNMKKISMTQPSLTVISPNGGELWEVGKTYTIQWKSENLPSGNNITIELLGSSGTKVLFSSIANNANSQNWTIPKDFPVGTYILKVISYAFRCGSSNSSCGDDTERPFSIVATTIAKTCSELGVSQKYYFNTCSDSGYDNVCFNKFTGVYQGCTRNTNNDCTINNANADQNILCPVTPTQKTITVLYPNGGESWEIGKTYEIKWTTTGYSPDGVVRIIITDESSGTENPIFNAYNKGSFSWTVPSNYQAHSSYKIKIVAPDEKYDKSDAPFSIVSPQQVVPPQPIACTDSDGGYNFSKYGEVKDALGRTFKDACLTDLSGLTEFACQSDGLYTSQFHSCVNEGKVCSEGACVSANGNSWCKDSDGRDFGQYGTVEYSVEGKNYSTGDYCSGEQGVTEISCDGKQWRTEYHSCVNEGKICSGGFCISSAGTSWCKDSDGGYDFNQYGKVEYAIEGKTSSYADICISEYELTEGACSGNQWTTQYHSCKADGKVCKNGACVAPGETGLKNIEIQLAKIYKAVLGLVEEIQKLLRR